MDLLSALQSFAVSTVALTWLNLLFQSAMVLGVFLLLDTLIGRRLSAQSRHLLWLNAMVCLILLPWVPLLLDATAIREAGAGRGSGIDAWFEITVTPANVSTNVSTAQMPWLIMGYLLPVIWLLMRMTVSGWHLRQLFKQSEPVSDTTTTTLLAELKHTLGISRHVTLRLSEQTDSPLSFGLLKPCVVLPAQSRDWSESVMTDVLLHELSHIRRLDWLTMILAWCVAAMYWINPLVWVAVRRLNQEAENSCDTAVLHAGRSDTDYAESLLHVAQACIHSAQSVRAATLPVQRMLERHTLGTRIQRILEEHTMNQSEKTSGKQLKKSFALTLLVSAATLGFVGDRHLVAAQTAAADVEMTPFHTPNAVYPARATIRKVEGWVQVRFTVTAEGTVDAQSIEVVDAQPAGMFDNSAIHAAGEFVFNPRIRNGAPVDVPNVQYVFRFTLDDEEVQ